MAKINNNGTTIADKTTGKHSAKSNNAITHALNSLNNSFDPTVKKNINTIATIMGLM